MKTRFKLGSIATSLLFLILLGACKITFGQVSGTTSTDKLEECGDDEFPAICSLSVHLRFMDESGQRIKKMMKDLKSEIDKNNLVLEELQQSLEQLSETTKESQRIKKNQKRFEEKIQKRDHYIMAMLSGRVRDQFNILINGLEKSQNEKLKADLEEAKKVIPVNKGEIDGFLNDLRVGNELASKYNNARKLLHKKYSAQKVQEMIELSNKVLKMNSSGSKFSDQINTLKSQLKTSKNLLAGYQAKVALAKEKLKMVNKEYFDYDDPQTARDRLDIMIPSFKEYPYLEGELKKKKNNLNHRCDF